MNVRRYVSYRNNNFNYKLREAGKVIVLEKLYNIASLCSVENSVTTKFEYNSIIIINFHFNSTHYCCLILFSALQPLTMLILHVSKRLSDLTQS